MNAIPLLLLCAAGAAPQYDGQLLDFSATWCGPCQQMNPIVHRLESQGLPIRQVDVDRERALAQKYGVTNIPAFVLVVNGKAVERVVGVTSESRLRAMIARIPKQAPPVAAAPQRDATTTATSTATSTDAGLGDAAAFPGTVRANIDQDDTEEVAAETDPSTPLPYRASVRIRVVDAEGVNFGSGTVVESKPGRTILLSCGHVFRDLSKESRIEVDVFQWKSGKITGRETFLGEVIAYDMESDVGLLSIPTQQTLPVCPIAKPQQGANVNDQVVNIGCSQGELPTRQSVRVKQLNRYLGPANIECTGVPVQGRSGGGLFSRQGEIVGICIARDPRDQEGIYAGLEAIHEMLDQQRLAHLYREVDDYETAATEPGADRPATAPTAAAPTAAANVPEDVAKVLDDAGEAEVICIIRKHGEPESRSRVVIINRASSKFVSYLGNEMQEQPRLTSGHIDRKDLEQSKPAPSMQQRLAGSGWQILRKPVAECGDRDSDRRPSSPQRYRRSANSRSLN